MGSKHPAGPRSPGAPPIPGVETPRWFREHLTPSGPAEAGRVFQVGRVSSLIEGREVVAAAPALLAISVRERRCRYLRGHEQATAGIQLTDATIAGKDVGGLNDPEKLLQLHLEPGPRDVGPRLTVVSEVPRVGEVAGLGGKPVSPRERRQDVVVDGRPPDVARRVVSVLPVHLGLVGVEVDPQRGDLRTVGFRFVVVRPGLIEDRQVAHLEEIGDPVGSHAGVDRLPAPWARLLRLRERVELERAVRAGCVRVGARLVGHRRQRMTSWDASRVGPASGSARSRRPGCGPRFRASRYGSSSRTLAPHARDFRPTEPAVLRGGTDAPPPYRGRESAGSWVSSIDHAPRWALVE